MDKVRLISAIVFLIIYSFVRFPVPTVVVSVVGIIVYVCFTFFSRKNVIDTGVTNRRKSALYTARAFLGNYDDIWSNLKLSNTYCYLSMIDEMTIIGVEKNRDGGSYRSFKVVKSKVHDWVELWNMFCINFSHNKTYDGLIEDCMRYALIIDERLVEKPERPKVLPEKVKPVSADKLVDINNAALEELTALPGVSVIMAKKTVKKREEIGGFKSAKEFFEFLELKPHIQEQLTNLICVKKMEKSAGIERFDERNVDL